MTAPVNARAAGAPQTASQDQPDATPQNADEQPHRSVLDERAFAALEAQLARELQESPPLAGEPAEGARKPLRPAPRRRPRSRRAEELEGLLNKLQELAGDEPAPLAARDRQRAEGPRAAHDAPRPERPLTAEFPRVERDPAERRPPDRRTRLQPETVPWIEPPERTSVFVRATRFAAIVFSVIAIAGVGALLVLLAVGDQWPMAEAPRDTARLEQVAAATSSTRMPPAQDEEPVEVASLAKRDTSRIEPDAPTPALRTERASTAEDAMGGPLVMAQAQEPEAAIGRTAPIASPSAPVANQAPAPAATTVETSDAETSSSMAQAPAEPEMQIAPPETNVAAFGGSGAAATAEVEPSAAAAATQTAPVTSHVNMRSGPNNDADVVAIVPEGKNVEVVDCERWCEVVFDGKQGFIHRRFVEGMGG